MMLNRAGFQFVRQPKADFSDSLISKSMLSFHLAAEILIMNCITARGGVSFCNLYLRMHRFSPDQILTS